MSAGNRCYLNDNTKDENTSGGQDTVLSGQGLRKKSGHDGSEPSTELKNSGEPALLCWVVDVSVGL